MCIVSRIFSLLGAPNVHIWPEVCIMPLVINYSIDLEREQAIHQYSNLPSLFMNIDDSGQDLLMRLLAYDPNKRMKVNEYHINNNQIINPVFITHFIYTIYIK